MCVFIQCLFAVNPDSDKYFGSVTLPLGKVFLKIQAEDNWVKVGVRDTVLINDKIKTLAKSRCEITVRNKMIMRIGEQAIVELRNNPNSVEDVKLEKGKIWVNLFFNRDSMNFNVRTPTSVCAVRGTVYRLNCDPNFTAYRVYEGSIAVTPLDEEGNLILDTTFTVNSGEELILAKDFEEYKRQQQEAFQKYLDEQQFGFEEYARQYDEYFREFQRQEKEAFKQFKSFHIAQEKFDQEKDSESDWVKWNNERDKLLQE